MNLEKEEFEKNVKKIQQKELQSDRFKFVQKFMADYRIRSNRDLENKLFKIVGNDEEQLLIKSYDDRKVDKTIRFNELKKFMNSLTQEQINSNIYLKTVAIYMETSIKDCKLIMEQLEEQLSNLKVSDENQNLKLNVNIPKERLNIFPTIIRVQVSVPYCSIPNYKVTSVNVLDEENLQLYNEYNFYVKKINKLANDIYHLQIWNLLSIYPEQINNYYFLIFNNDSEQQFKTAYYVKKCRENITTEENKTYQLYEKTIEKISKVIGLSLDEIIKIGCEDLKKHMVRKILEETSYNLRMRMAGILADEEYVITIEQVDKERKENTNELSRNLKK